MSQDDAKILHWLISVLTECANPTTVMGAMNGLGIGSDQVVDVLKRLEEYADFAWVAQS